MGALHVVLYEPDIPGNAGNVGRSCVATGSTLHFVGKLGFSLDNAYLKCSGLDYWPKVKLVLHEDWNAFEASLPRGAALYFFSKKAPTDYWRAIFASDSYLIFGCETTGLPESIHRKYGENSYHLPMRPDSVRSLNLSTSVGVVLYEALRQVSQGKGLPW